MQPTIQGTEFGSITVDDEVYDHDIVIRLSGKVKKRKKKLSKEQHGTSHTVSLRGSGWAVIAAGCVVLACYGLMVNTVKWDFSKLLGVYVAVFAVVSVLCGLLAFKETVPISTWLGLGLIVVGGLVIQFGHG